MLRAVIFEFSIVCPEMEKVFVYFLLKKVKRCILGIEKKQDAIATIAYITTGTKKGNTTNVI